MIWVYRHDLAEDLEDVEWGTRQYRDMLSELLVSKEDEDSVVSLPPAMFQRVVSMLEEHDKEFPQFIKAADFSEK